ncbi:MAG: hypothetical protein NC313_09880 [Butyrivibrio sp.]|nr:hypothetical protein [Butyrivibrio sp.]
MRIFIRKNIRMDMERHYKWGPYNKALNVAKQYFNVGGLRECYTNFVKDGDAYDAKLTGYLEMEKTTENEKYNHFKSVAQAYNICIWCGIGLILIRFFLFYAMQSGSLEVLYLLGKKITYLYVIVLIVLRVMAIMAEKKYLKYKDSALWVIKQINDEFVIKIQAFEKEIDQMYLDSLDPVALQVELLRRELAEQNKRNEELSKEMVNIQNKMLESQERTEKQVVNNGQIQQGILNNLNEWRDERHNRY